MNFGTSFKITQRIKAIKSLVPNGARLLDVGSDHAFLPISLCLDGVISSAVISDVNAGPLERGKLHVASLCPNLKASFYLSDGFEKIPRDSYDVAAICGMGGELIAGILEEGAEKAYCPLILQPMSHAERLREYLWCNGFTVNNELYVEEERHCYVIISAQYTGRSEPFDNNDLYLGKLRPISKEYAAYAKKIAAAARKRLEGARHKGDVAEIAELNLLIDATEAIKHQYRTALA